MNIKLNKLFKSVPFQNKVYLNFFHKKKFLKKKFLKG